MSIIVIELIVHHADRWKLGSEFENSKNPNSSVTYIFGFWWLWWVQNSFWFANIVPSQGEMMDQKITENSKNGHCSVLS